MVNKEVLDNVIQFVNNSPDYSFKKFLGENNLLSGYNERGNDFWVRCPFHLDENASCSFNDTTHGFHCFSCGRSGNYIKFVSMYKSEKLGNTTNFYAEAEKILKSDPSMQALIGNNTIYQKESEIDSYEKLPHLDVAKTDAYDLYVPDSFVGLSKLMIAKKCSLQEIKKMISLMQHDVPVQEIYKEVFEKSVSSRAEVSSAFSSMESLQKPTLDLDELLSDD